MNTIIVGNYVENVYPYIEKCFICGYPQFIFDEFKLIFEDDFWGRVETIVKINSPTLEHFQEYENNPLYPSDIWFGFIDLINYSDRYEEPKDYRMSYESENGTDFYLTGTDGDNYNRGEFIDNIMRFIMSRLETREKVTKEVNHRASMNKLEIKRTDENADKNIFLMKDICKYFYLGEKPNNQNVSSGIQCPCWSVRGHYRHYKSGKVVFVKEYTKGKDRANAQPKDKTYTV